MPYSIRKIIFSFIFNTSLFLMLFMSIQNSSNKSKVNFIFYETIRLPVSFIIGVSFVCGSFVGSCIKITDFFNEK